eukprot:TRINITY_DN19362_c0_g1_i1.p1 TRINITY_DN19362_c0_g1~~TRINITY_DN19362_c0_g1_i1.p1  ORF type:complete len:276 (+),score=112.96 TRINITY_DN19362_c0_g1_i1:120-947(+)
MFFFFLMIRRPPRSTQSRSSAASDVYKRQSFSKAALPVEESIQFFGSTQKRWYEVDQAQSYMAGMSLKTPGPGAYVLGDEIKKRTSKQRTSFLKDGEVGFSSTTNRVVVDEKNRVPGPGSYTTDNSRGEFVQQLEKKLRSRTGAFLSSDERFPAEPLGEALEPVMEEPDNRKREPQKFPKHAGFLSHTDRFVEPEKDLPAPGAYDTQGTWAPKNTTLASNKSFASSAARFNPKEVFTGCPLKDIPCLLYTSDAADDLLCVDLGGRRIIKKKKNIY